MQAIFKIFRTKKTLKLSLNIEHYDGKYTSFIDPRLTILCHSLIWFPKFIYGDLLDANFVFKDHPLFWSVAVAILEEYCMASAVMQWLFYSDKQIAAHVKPYFLSRIIKKLH